MMKTTVYLSEALKRDLELVASTEGVSEAELIRDAIRTCVEQRRRRAPRLPLVDRPFGDPSAARRVDQLLDEGFGQ